MTANGGQHVLFVRLQLYFKLSDKVSRQCHGNVQLNVECICFSKPGHGLKLLSRI